MRLRSSFLPAAGAGWRRLARSAMRAIGTQPSVRVIIYGEHSSDWMTALAPGAPVWRRMPDVGEVLLIPDIPGAIIPKTPRADARTVIIPLMESHARHRPRQYASLVPDGRSIDVLANKAAFAAYARAHGFGYLCPQTYASSADAVFPCVLKRLDLNAGEGVAIVGSPLELKARLEEYPWDGWPVILQSLAAGATEYVTHCVCRNGRILWHCSFAYEAYPLGSIRNSANVATVRPVTASAFSLSQIETFLAPLSYSGPCNADYKLSADGKITVFEINPRLGGSLMMPANVGYLHGALRHIVDTALDAEHLQAGPAHSRGC